jgi:hypothetical protein
MDLSQEEFKKLHLGLKVPKIKLDQSLGTSENEEDPDKELNELLKGKNALE